MHKLSPVHAYRREGKLRLIELRLSNIDQFFNSLDPSPFHSRDLDDDAVEWLMDSMRELSFIKEIKLIIYLPDDSENNIEAMIQQAINYFFTYRARVHRQHLRSMLRDGEISLVIGLVFLTFCIAFIKLLPMLGGGADVLREGLLIIGWVAFWRPLQIFLYDWWPFLRDARLCERIARLPVEVHQNKIEGKMSNVMTDS